MFATVKSARRLLDDTYAADPALYAECHKAMQERQRDLGNLYGGEPIPSVPDPLLLDREKFRPFQKSIRRLRRLLERTATRLVENDKFVEVFGVEPLHADLIRASATRPGRPTPIVRIDGMLTDRGKFAVLEVNTDGSTGLQDAYCLGAAAASTPALRRVAAEYRLTSQRVMAPLARQFTDLWQADGRSGVPRVAILDWAEVKSRYEQQSLAEQLTAAGIPTVWCDPRELRFSRGRLMGPGGRVDIVYKRVLTAELMLRRSEVDAYLQAILAGKVLQVDPFTADLVYDKGMLALIQDPTEKPQQSALDRACVRDLVPFTRFFPSGGALRTRALKQKDQMILKPRNEYGGKGVVLGPEVGKRAWARAVDEAEAAGNFLLQRFVPPPPHELWVPRGKTRAQQKVMHSIMGVWILGESTPGFYFRAGPKKVINVSGGAYGVPVLFAKKR